MSDEERFTDGRGLEIERKLWTEYAARRATQRHAFWFRLTCGFLLAVVMGLNLGLVWLIWLH